MYNSKNMKELKEKIEVDKELLSTMPKNNSKSIAKYVKKIEEIQNNYIEQRDEIYEILNNRYKNGINIEENPEIQYLGKKIQDLENDVYILNKKKTSYEKMDLDKIIYKIRKYYKGNFDIVNEQIAIVLDKFSDIGIELQIEDFDYSIYVKQYMEVFLEEYKNKTLSSEKLKNKFEELYWKCPEIIVHIELNIRNLYFKNETQIDKYFLKRKEEILNDWAKTPDEIIKFYLQLVAERLEKISHDKKIILEAFLEGKENTKNYKTEKIVNDLKKILPQEIVKKIDENGAEIKQNISKFLNSLYEYKDYEEFKFIVDDIKKIYKEKDKYKNIYEETKKKIDLDEKKLKKLNKKAETGLFGKKVTSPGMSAEQNALISELKNMYKKLDLDKFYNKVYSEVTEDTTIYQALRLANSYYEYLTTCIIKNDSTIMQDGIDQKVNELNTFLKSPYNTIINNITIMQDIDIGMIIKDRYRLLNFNVEKEDLQIDNIDNLISILEEIQKSFNIESAGLKIEEIEEMVQLKKVLKK